MFRSYSRILTAGACALVYMIALVQAQDAGTTASPITYSGFFDGYYIKNLAGPVTLKNPIRVFDPTDNEFNLAFAEVAFTKKAEPVGFRVDTGIFQQAYLTVVVPVGDGLTVDVGKFVTHMGFEVIESKDNWNYSRSILFGWAIPFYHTGARLSYPVMSNLTATVSILNGWNSISDNNKFKTLGLMVNYAVLPSTSIILCGISGVEASEPAVVGKRNVYNVIVTHTLMDDLALAVDFDYGEERVAAGLATWKGEAIYAKYTLGAQSAIALRYEMYNDASNFGPLSTGAAQKLSEFTGTYEYKPWDNLIVRAEVRDDMSDVTYFDSGTPAKEKSQLTLTLGAIVTF
ncbi:MAG: porin [Ignavibacteriales bacterium]|nr:porin [Ignavibacteriales bacterium]